MTSKLISILLIGIICPNHHSQKSKQKPQIDPTIQCTKRHWQSEKILKITVGRDFTYQQPRRQISAGLSAHHTPPNLEISKTYKHTHPPDQTPTSETLMKITNSSRAHRRWCYVVRPRRGRARLHPCYVYLRPGRAR